MSVFFLQVGRILALPEQPLRSDGVRECVCGLREGMALSRGQRGSADGNHQGTQPGGIRAPQPPPQEVSVKPPPTHTPHQRWI